MRDIALAAQRLLIGVLVAWLHGWHNVVDGWYYATAGSAWTVVGLVRQAP